MEIRTITNAPLLSIDESSRVITLDFGQTPLGLEEPCYERLSFVVKGFPHTFSKFGAFKN